MGKEQPIEILTDNAYYILVSLTEDRHGYLIMQTIEELTDGGFIIGPASLYTNLKKLLQAGYIVEKPAEKSNQKVYGITSQGIEVLRNEIERKKSMVILGEQRLSRGQKR